MSISDTILVTTVVRDSVPSVADFGTPLILAYHGNFVGVRQYDASATGLAAMATDGFSLTCDAYLKAAAIVSQPLHCSKLKVASRAAANAQSVVLTPAYTTVGRVVSYTLYYLGVAHAVTYTIQAADTAADIVTGLIASLGVVTGITIGGTTTQTLALTDETDGERFYLRNTVGLTVEDVSVDAGIAADLTAALAADSSWYGLLIDSHSPLEIAAVAPGAETASRVFGAQSLDSDNLVEDDGIGYTLSQLNYNYTYVIPSRDSYGQGASALMGRQFSRAPGASTWAHKALSGVVADAYTSAEFTAARDNGCLVYVLEENDIEHTLDGAAVSGRFIDITRGLDWLEAQITAQVMAVYLNNEKIPYTDAGAAQFEAALRAALSAGQTAGILAAGWTVTRPLVSSQSTADKAARHFPNLNWNGVLAGAIHSGTIEGTVIV